MKTQSSKNTQGITHISVSLLISFLSLFSGSLHAQCGLTQLTAVGGGNLCNGTRTAIVVLVPGNQAGVTYELKRNGVDSGYPSIIGTGSASISWTITSGTGNYTVVAKSGSCSQQMSGSVTVISQLYPIADITPSENGCNTSLTGNPPNAFVTYEWRFNSLTGAVISTSQVLQPKQGGYYYLKVANACGNSSSNAGYYVSSIPKIEIVPSSSPVNACPGLTLTAAGGTNYNWALPGGLFSSLPSIGIGSGSVGGNYTLTGTNICNVQESTTLAVSLLPVLTAPATTQNVVIKENSTTQLTASGAGTNETYAWFNSAETFITNAATYTTPALSNNTNYYVAKVSTNGTKCQSPKVPINVTVNKKPVVNAGVDQSILFPATSTTLAGTASDAEGNPLTYTWSKVVGGNFVLSNPNSLSTSVTGLDVVPYTFRLSVSDGFNDPVYDDVNVTVVYPPNNYNYVKETIVLKKGAYSENDVSNLIITDGEKSEITNYVDGLGRQMQKTLTQGSPLAKDMVFPTVYDQYGRNNRKYLPGVVNETNGHYKKTSTIIDPISGNYIGAAAGLYAVGSNNNVADDTRPFGEVLFELSPLNRPDKNYDPGSAWFSNNKYSQIQFMPNIHGLGNTLVEEKIIIWKLSSGLPIRDESINSGYYTSGSLYIVVTKDEEGAITRTYTDKYGKMILKKVQLANTPTSLNSDAQWALTYFIYDDRGNLLFVLQPELCRQLLASDTFNPSATSLNSLAFQYKYDTRQRMIEKKLPGVDAVYMVYDKLDRLVLTQDGNQRKDVNGSITKKEWTFFKYDAMGRIVINGIYTHGTVVDGVTMSSQISVVNFFEAYNGTTSNHGYTNVVFPTTNTKALIVTYYDNYKFRDDLAGASSYAYIASDLTGQETTANTDVVGKITGSKVNILETTNYLWNITYYDQKYRIIQTKSQNHKNGIDRVTNIYDFVRLKESKTIHHNGTTSYPIHRKFDYDHMGRLVNTWHKFHTEPNFVLLAKNSYNELGQVTSKKTHSRDNGVTFAQKTDFDFTIRGWLKKINDPLSPETSDLFSMELRYNDPGVNGGAVKYNGDISEAVWKMAGAGNQSYGYTYDRMNRLTEGKYYDIDKPINNGNFTEKIGDPSASRISYDLNGNIQNLIRYGKRTSNQGGYGKLDDLSYLNYSGNQVTKIDDVVEDIDDPIGFTDKVVTTNEYAYDANGNVKKDLNKGVTGITYNYLNLPLQVSKSASEYVTYSYDALGKKLAQQVYGTTPKTTDYISDFVYENMVLQSINHDEGRIVADNSVNAPRPWEYQYFLKDHLGNIRVSFSEKTTSIEYLATMETEPASLENDETSKFLNLVHSKKIQMYNHTPGKSNSYRLSACPGEVVGPAKSFTVNPGEVYDLEVFARYEAPTTAGSDVGNFLSSIVNAFMLNPSGGTGVDGQQAYNKFTNLFSSSAWVGGSKYEDVNVPRAFLNFLLFDENFNLVDAGFDQVSAVAATAHDYISLHVKVQQKGFLYIYLSNENDKIANVFFDDFKITQRMNIVQASDYYPFGLAFNTYQRTGNVGPNYGYNGKELQDELDLRWLDYGARMYMPDIGRWGAADPLAEKYVNLSPYSYVANNPTRLIDPDGREIWLNFTWKDENGVEQTLRLQYINGVLYNEDGTVYDGSSPADPLIQTIRRQLMFIQVMCAGNWEVDKIFRELQSTTNIHDIIIRTNSTDPNAKIEDRQPHTDPKFWFWDHGSTIYFDPLDERDWERGEGRLHPSIALLHELKHAYDEEKGTEETDARLLDEKTGKTQSESSWEVRAVSTENILRLRMGVPVRTTYNGGTILVWYDDFE